MLLTLLEEAWMTVEATAARDMDMVPKDTVVVLATDMAQKDTVAVLAMEWNTDTVRIMDL